MASQPSATPEWYRSSPVLLTCMILLPPVGLVLLWMHPDKTIFKKLFGTLATAAITMVHLMLFFGMRVEMNGSGMPAFVTFRDAKKHAAWIEESRAKQPTAPVKPEEHSVVAAAAPPGAAVPAAAPSAAAPPAAAPPPAAAAPYWTSYRGPLRDGHYTQMPVITQWPAKGLKPLWKIPVGGGYASVVMASGKAFTIEQRGSNEVIAAYDVQTGREVWKHSYAANFQESMGGDGPRATPSWDGGLLYSMGATGELKVLDADSGNVKWQKNILTDNGAQNLTWAMAAAPLIVDDKVIVQPGGMDGKSVVAYNKLTGEPVWKSLNDQQAYTTPMLVTLAGKRQILTATAQRVIGLDPENGKLLWESPWSTEYDVNAAQPILIDANRFVISAGYDHGSALLEISKAGEGFQVKTVWQNKKMKNKFSSSVLLDGYLYGLDENILACVRVSDGNQMWKGGRYGYGQLLLASGHLIVITESGELVLVKASPEKLIEVSKSPAIEGKTWNVPAIADGVLIVRNLAEMAAFRIAR